MRIDRKGIQRALLIGLLSIILLIPVPSLAAANVTVVNESYPITMLAFVPCAAGGQGEMVELTGTMHYVYHLASNPKGGYQLTTSYNPQGLSGRGLTTGVRYQAVGITRTTQSVNAGSQDTYVNNYRLIGQGRGGNFLVHENMHYTVNANGTLTVSHDNLRFDCK